MSIPISPTTNVCHDVYQNVSTNLYLLVVAIQSSRNQINIIIISLRFFLSLFDPMVLSYKLIANISSVNLLILLVTYIILSNIVTLTTIPTLLIGSIYSITCVTINEYQVARGNEINKEIDVSEQCILTQKKKELELNWTALMGARNSKAIVAPKEIQSKIKGKSKEYENIKLHFQQLSKTYDLSNGRISKEIFINSYLRQRLPSFSDDLLERFFIVLAFDGKDYIIFEEFLQTKYLLEHIPCEPQEQISKSADDFYTEDDIIYEYRLKLIFNLFDLDFNGFISIKEYQKILPILMQNNLYRKMDVEEMKEYDEWFNEISNFAMVQFDRTKLQRLSWRDFRQLSRHDLTIQNAINKITPKMDEFQCFKYAKAIQRKNQKKKSKKDRKLKQKKKY
eukprot:416056_1